MGAHARAVEFRCHGGSPHHSKIRKAEVLATGEELDFRRLCGNSELPGDYIINVPKTPDPLMTVVKLSFDEVIKLGE